MNWFKRLLNKVTEEEQTEELEKTDYIERNEPVEKTDVGRPKFRFPLIPDEQEMIEGDPLPAPPPPREDHTAFDPFEANPLPAPSSPKGHRTSREPFAPSGGRLPLPKHLRDGGQESWRTGEDRYSPAPPVRREPEPPRTWEETSRTLSRTAKPALDERPRPPKRARGFMISDVPSPVYGYMKPPAPPVEPAKVESPETGLADLIRERETDGGGRSADEVIEQHRPDTELPLPNSGKDKEKQTSPEENILPVKSEQEPMEKAAAEQQPAEELVITRVSDLTATSEPEPPVQKQEAEGSVTAVRQAEPMQEEMEKDQEKTAPALPQQTLNDEPERSEQESVTDVSESEKRQPKRKSGTPFNVVMLKSDRQRMEQLERLKGLKPSAGQTDGPKPYKEANESRPVEPDHENEPVTAEPRVQVSSETAASRITQEEPTAPAYPEEIPESESDTEEQPPHYVFPDRAFLLEPEVKSQDAEWMESQAAKLEEALSYFSVKSKVIGMVQGPAVTQFELKVGHGTKVSKIRNLQDDLKLALAARDIRIQAPIPGKSSIGIEIPNRVSRPVRISEVIGSQAFEESDSPLEAVLGLDLAGRPSTIDLRKMPHGLIAGATGSGKSVCINSILTSLLYKATPDELRLLLIDPKMVELAPYNRIPHLVSPVITDVKAANAALKWAVEEMERRYELFAHGGVRDIARYNQKAEEHREFSKKLPYLLIVIDELADLMMVAPAEVEESICRIAQKARACGIHLVIATQRPSVDVITGLIKANVPTRIAFSVSSQVDSRTIIDVPGAERLLGKGDMLYLGNGMSAPARLQGTFVTDDEIERVTEYVRRSGEPDYLFRQEELIKKAESHEAEDPLFEDACRFIAEAGSASTSMLQRKFSIGYNRAARLIDMLEDRGFVSPQKGSKPRDVYLTQDAAATEQPDGPAHTI
ncbi:DNA translocase FtsK [Bhargavaea cecembensis]|uniref:DNA translocase FtsK n=1 Tax=Bhargavaea cecembensis TaxID=394098 RepID=UPI0009EE27D5|nr:DNA translocase FtsK [Bhargavaea cecembensis]